MSDWSWRLPVQKFRAEPFVVRASARFLPATGKSPHYERETCEVGMALAIGFAQLSQAGFNSRDLAAQILH
jgi:hypothetical protein